MSELLIWAAICFGFGVLLIVAAIYIRRQLRRLATEEVEAEFLLAFDAYIEGHKSVVLIADLNELEHVSKLDGFHSVITLLKYRHRGRSLRRLKKLYEDWQESVNN